MKKTLLLWLFGLLLTTQVFAQNRSLSGTVKDATTGEALIGVNVTGKGTTIGTVTDIDGKYTLELPKDVTALVFSYVGYTNLEKTILSLTVDAAMAAEGNQLEELVITALALERNKNSVGYANQTVKSEDLNKVVQRSALNALQGKVAGVNITQASGAVGASTRIVLRGESSLTGGNNALIVVDGIPISNSGSAGGGGQGDERNYVDFGNRGNDINPEDIESMTVLKGPAATSLYGSRGAAGVVLITTKKGTTRDKKGVKVGISSGVTFDKPYIVLKRQDKFGQGYASCNCAGTDFNTGENFSWGPRLDGVVRPWTSPVLVNGQLTQLSKPYSAVKNQLQSFFDLGITNRNSISFDGGSDKFNYYFSYTNLNNKGIIPHTYLKRNTFNANATANLSEKFSAEFGVIYTRTNQRGATEGGSFDNQVLYRPAYLDLIQTPVDIPVRELRDYNSPFHDFAGYYGTYNQNSYFILDNTFLLNNVDNVFGKASISYKPIKDLKLTARVGNNFILSNTQEKYPQYQYLPHDVWTDGVLEPHDRQDNFSAGLYSEGMDKRNELTIDVIANYSRELGKKKNFKIAVLGGYNYFEATRNQITGNTVGGLLIPGFYSLSNSSTFPETDNLSRHYRIFGAYGNLSVSYKNLLTIDYSARNDWSSTLPKGNNGFFYQAGSVSFVPTELFKQPNKWLSYAKIRANIGTTGKDAGTYLLNSVFVVNPAISTNDGGFNVGFPFNDQGGATLGNTIGSPNLSPELTTTYEGGVDLGLFNDRLNFEYTYYHSNHSKQIVNVNLPPSSGYLFQAFNIGKMVNKGHELMVKAKPFNLKQGYSMNLFFSFTKNINKVIKIADGIDELQIGALAVPGNHGPTTIVAAEGLPFGTYKAIDYLRDPAGNIIVNENGFPQIDLANPKYFGNYQPNYRLSFGGDINIKGFTMSVLFDYKNGGQFFSYSKSNTEFNGTSLTTVVNGSRDPIVFPNSVIQTAPGVFTPNTIPVGIYNYLEAAPSSTYLIDGTYLKLREASIGYTVPSKAFKNVPISSISLSLIGRNLMFWLPKENTFADPEVSGSGLNSDEVGVESVATPSTRSVGFDLKITF